MKNSRVLPVFLVLIFVGCSHNSNPAEYSDLGIRIKVREALRDQPSLDISRLTIDVHSRTVTVSGIVRSEADRDLLDKTISRTKGVEQALINVVVQE